MSGTGKFVAIAAVACLIAHVAIFAHRTSGLVLIGMLILFFFVSVAAYGFLLIFAEWRQRRWRAALPFAVCLLTVVIFHPLVNLARQAVFAWSLPSYEAIIKKVKSGEIPASAEFNEIPQVQAQARLAESVDAQKDADGTVRVMFWTEDGFPVLHSGYLYTSSGEPGSDMESHWPLVEKVRSNWFFISN